MDDFVVKRFTEADSPKEAKQAWHLLAESYIDSGYVEPRGVGKDGCLHPEIDTLRGENVEYYLGRTASRQGGYYWASLRRKSIPDGGDVSNLSAFQNSNPHMYPGEETLLRKHIKQHGYESLVEIGALAKTKSAPSLVSMWLIRRVVHEAATANPNEKWLILFAEPAYDSMRRFFGSNIVRQVGHKICSIKGGSEYVNPQLRFIPSVIEPGKVVSILEESPNSQRALEFMLKDSTQIGKEAR